MNELEKKRATDRAWFYMRDTINLGVKFAKDPNRVSRRSLGECRLCFYSTHIAGQAFTRYACQFCGVSGYHANTNVPKLCRECADKDQSCIKCGGDREVKPPLQKKTK